ERLAAAPPGHIGDQLRLAVLGVDQHTSGADLVAAAQQALRFGELTLAERLARAALDRSDGLAARLALGYALAWQGRGREADAVAVGWGASAAALSSARTGALEHVEALARRATAADHPGLLRFTSGFGRITALVMAGRVTEARMLAQRYTDFAELQQPGRAI